MLVAVVVLALVLVAAVMLMVGYAYNYNRNVKFKTVFMKKDKTEMCVSTELSVNNKTNSVTMKVIHLHTIKLVLTLICGVCLRLVSCVVHHVYFAVSCAMCML